MLAPRGPLYHRSCSAGSDRELRPDPRGRPRLRPGLNAVTGETGAARRSSRRRSGSCSARRVTPATSARARRRPTSRPSSTRRRELDDRARGPRRARPAGRRGSSLRAGVRRRTTRAYAWAGPSAGGPRDARRAPARHVRSVRAAPAGRPHQLDVLDAFVGDEQLRRRADLGPPWRELLAARRRRSRRGAAAGGTPRRARRARCTYRGHRARDEDACLPTRAAPSRHRSPRLPRQPPKRSTRRPGGLAGAAERMAEAARA